MTTRKSTNLGTPSDLVATLHGDPVRMLSNDGVNLGIPLEQVGLLEHAGDPGHGLGGRGDGARFAPGADRCR
jgi:hypothetical protein